MASTTDEALVANYMFRGIEYIVTAHVDKPDSLTIEVEDRLTTDHWTGLFDARYVEDLTHKTGNFKQFNIFVDMLETALTKSSDSVSLDLLTYADLDSLRARKSNQVNRSFSSSNKVPTNVGSKRYLILTYTVEFDRIHYPLPLIYQGKPDPRALKETIRHLRSELKCCKREGGSDFKLNELENLGREYDLLRKEKNAIEDELQELQEEMKLSSTKGGSKHRDIRALKTMVKNLEEDLVKEKTKHQRALSKLNSEIKQLLTENEELVASERNLKVRVKSLTNEMAMYKRRVTLSPVPGPRSAGRDPSREKRSASRERTNYERPRSLSRERSSSKDRFGGAPSTYRRERSSSTERQRPHSSLSGRKSRSPSPSPAGCRAPRFDPTAYIKEKERRRKETDLKKGRHVQSGISRSVERQPRPFSTSPGYLCNLRRTFDGASRKPRSRTSSAGSLSDAGSDTSAARKRNRKKVLKGRTSTSSYWSSPDVPFKKPPSSKRVKHSTPANVQVLNDVPKSKNKENHRPKHNAGDKLTGNRSMDLSDIEGRLTRLQQFLHSNMPS
ncbi:centrosomal protein CCDC61-like isoform X2 [Tubulanus polymorphus]|uniref:centrosomal protein CCDC61-like isoform X2 n=1 Tax=Tubulanus polymorphus TaxID=672921 RepID=UPI003DA373C1